MKSVVSIVYRYPTDAEFFNIYKPRGTEERGGGQKYIDFPTSDVSLAAWDNFFSGVEGVQRTQRAQGPSWNVPIYSLGLEAVAQTVTIYQRRKTSVCVAAQHVHAHNQNRVLAWHPRNGFPEPADPANRQQLPRGLAVFLIKSVDGEIWAGWFHNDAHSPAIFEGDEAAELLRPMLENTAPSSAGIINIVNGSLFFDETIPLARFTLDLPAGTSQVAPDPPDREGPARRHRTEYRRARSDAEILDSLFGEDSEQAMDDLPLEIKEVTARVRIRNTRAVRDLKELYGYRCQLTGDRYSFRKTDGEYYCEAHHLVPLGTGGADDPKNIVIVSPLIHRMLHYAEVTEIDLSNVELQPNGTYTLQIAINQEPYTITWRPEHAARVLAHREPSSVNVPQDAVDTRSDKV